MNDDKPPEHRKQTFLHRIWQLLGNCVPDQNHILTTLQAAHKQGFLDGESLAMMEGILQFAGARAKDIMIPRVKMQVLAIDTPIKNVFASVIDLGHSRFPVVEGDSSEVVGVLLAKDLLAHTTGNNGKIVADLMRPASIIPESKRLNVLLKEFRTKRQHMAIVVDEYGMTAGLITIEDILEEIVGEIEDEYDSTQAKYITQHSNNKFTINALTPITKFNEYFAANLQDHEHETIGGFVVSQLLHMPSKGEKLVYNDFNFEIVHADDRRVYLLKLRLT